MRFRYWAIIYIILSLLLFSPLLFTGGDNARYIILAESLTHGEYRDLQFPGEPPHNLYPPGFPLLLAPVVAVAGRNIIVLKLWIVLFGVGGFWFFHKITQSISPPRYATLITLMYLLTPVLLEFNHWVLSEVPYLCASLGSIYFVIKGEKR